MVIAYRQDGGEDESGGWTEQDVASLLPAMKEQCGCTIIRVYDGIAEAREKFPPGTRVIAHRKWWKSQAGTVEADGEWPCDSMGAHVPVRFDGDAGALGWWASGLEVLGYQA